MADTIKRTAGSKDDLQALRVLYAKSQLQEIVQRRLIRRLRDDQQVPYREIGRAVRLSHVEVRRRYEAQKGQSEDPTPREIILQRQAGEISTEQMMEALLEFEYTAFRPAANDWDPLAVIALPKGTIEQIGEAFDDGLLTDEEHDQIVSSETLKVLTTQMPEQ